MQIATASLHDAGNPDAGRLLADQTTELLGGGMPDLCLLFASAHFDDAIEQIASDFQDHLSPRALIGCTAETVVRDGCEYENQPTIAVWAASMPDVQVRTFHLSQEDLERLGEPPDWHDHLDVTPEQQPYFILLADPFQFNLPAFLEQFNRAYPKRPAIGGVASAGEAPRQNAMIFEGQTLRSGLCGVALRGAVEIDTVVSQGCRPIGRHLIVTEAERNIIRTLGGKPPLTVLIETLHKCSNRDIELARAGGVLIGRAINEYQTSFTRGDFLIRNPIGFEEDSGAMAINDLIYPGQTIQFHVRDRESADDDLISLLTARSRANSAGALLFTCNGRGSRMFGRRHHDARAVADTADNLPIGGMSCSGEIGPIGHSTFIHSFTASVAFFQPAERVPKD